MILTVLHIRLELDMIFRSLWNGVRQLESY
jgi:hypothetical protein